MKVGYVKLDSRATEPTKGSEGSAGFDLYALIDEGTIDIPEYEGRKIHTGIAMAIPEGYFGAIYARSGLATKRGLRPSNCVGVVDLDYRGEIIVALFNDSDKCQTIHDGDRIAQLVLIPYLNAELKETEILNNTERGAGGFGSTGDN